MTKNSFFIKTMGYGEPLVLLHGWGWHSGVWQVLLPALTEKYQVTLIDLPGFGQSTAYLNNYSIESISEFLLDATPHHSTWLGWSLGGMIAWYMAAFHPDRVSRLITIASSPKFLIDDGWPGVNPDTLKNFYVLLKQNQEKTLLDFLELQLRGSDNRKKYFDQLKFEIIKYPARIDALLGGLHLLETLDLRNANVQCPRLHIFGSHDTLVPAKVVPLIESPDARCKIIPRSGHMPFLTQSEEFLKIMHK